MQTLKQICPRKVPKQKSPCFSNLIQRVLRCIDLMKDTIIKQKYKFTFYETKEVPGKTTAVRKLNHFLSHCSAWSFIFSVISLYTVEVLHTLVRRVTSLNFHTWQMWFEKQLCRVREGSILNLNWLIRKTHEYRVNVALCKCAMWHCKWRYKRLQSFKQK